MFHIYIYIYLKHQCFTNFFQTETPKIIFHTLKNLAYENNDRPKKFIYTCIYIKGKAVPLQAWSGPKGSRKLRFPDYMTTVQDGAKVVGLTHR